MLITKINLNKIQRQFVVRDSASGVFGNSSFLNVSGTQQRVSRPPYLTTINLKLITAAWFSTSVHLNLIYEFQDQQSIVQSSNTNNFYYHKRNTYVSDF